jgi:signal peptidase II
LPHADHADETPIQAEPLDRTPDAPAGDHAPVRRGRILWWVTALVVGLDQATKAGIRAWLPLFDSFTGIPGMLDITHVRNEGVAFGLFNTYDLPYKAVMTTGLAVLALAGITYYARHLRPHEWLARTGLSLILGGAIGNLIDRVTTGYVLDFVDVYWGDWHFWAFNVADASITIGAVLVFADLLFVNRQHVSHPV